MRYKHNFWTTIVRKSNDLRNSREFLCAEAYSFRADWVQASVSGLVLRSIMIVLSAQKPFLMPNMGIHDGCETMT